LVLGGNVSIAPGAQMPPKVPSISGHMSLHGLTRTIDVPFSNYFPGASIFADIVDGSASSGIVKTGDGFLRIAGDNSYSGMTQVNAGILSFAASTAPGKSDGTAATGTVVADGASLVLESGAVGNERVSLAGSGDVAFATFSGSGGGSMVSWAGPIQLTSDVRINADLAGTSFTLSGPISGAGSITFGGNGT